MKKEIRVIKVKLDLLVPLVLLVLVVSRGVREMTVKEVNKVLLVQKVLVVHMVKKVNVALRDYKVPLVLLVL